MCNLRALDDAVIVKLLLKAGAIPMVRGNCAQGDLGLITLNLIWGLAKNPLNKFRQTGGSSGGDCGLVATKCVPFSIATDLDGGIRIPAAFTGVYGFKPT